MIVLDASAAVEWLLRTSAGLRIEERIFVSRDLHAPHLLDLEVTQVLRRLLQANRISREQAETALQNFGDAYITRHSHWPLLPRIWQLRHNLAAYDAVYVALAEALRVPLVARDRKLLSAAGHTAEVEIF